MYASGRSLFYAAMFSLGAAVAVGASTAVSANNRTVDTTVSAAGELVVTMHRVVGRAFENASAGAGIDEALRVRGYDRRALEACPTIPLDDVAPHLLEPRSGLVADGVTPLLFHVTGVALAGSVDYEVSLVVRTGPWAACPDLNPRLTVFDGMACRLTREFTLTPDFPDAYLVLNPVHASELEDDAGGIAWVELIIKRKQASWLSWMRPFPAHKVFGVRKPPVVLVHGYNSSEEAWSSAFKNVMAQDRGSDFVVPVGYGLDGNPSFNTVGNLDDLAIELDTALRSQFENDVTSRWAMTRYDAVGHSQGGVLLRLLCSENGPSNLDPLVWQFRQAANHYRGRFHRVVTIGSPHFGSTLAHLGRRMLDENIPFGESRMEDLTDVEKDRLLQRKFQIDANTSTMQPSLPPTPRKLHQSFMPDPTARIHLLGATILARSSEGLLPGGEPYVPGIYLALYLHVNSAWGDILLPHGSDGVVDLRSQLAGTSAGLPGSALAMFTRLPAEENVAHASAGKFWHFGDFHTFGTTRNETDDTKVAETVRDLLNEPDGPASSFGPFPTFAACTPIYNEMDDVIQAIENEILPGIRAYVLTPAATLYISQNGSSAALNPQALATQSWNQLPLAAEVVNLTVQWVDGEGPAGPAEWSAVVYGPDGISTQGLALTTSGNLAEHLRIDVAADVIGDVVVSVRYPSVSGKTVIGQPGVVLSRPPGVLVGIDLQPGHVALLAGPSIPLDAWGVYDAGPSTLLFTDALNMTYTSAAPAIASVTVDGQISLLSPGQTTITGVYSCTYTGTVAVTVLAPSPVITSPATAVVAIGEPFSYQIAASGGAVSYEAVDLPVGLTFSSETGLVEGSSTNEGLHHFTVGAANADGQVGRLDVSLTVTGSNQAPTDIRLDSGSAPALQPANALVGRLATVDANPLDAHTYALVAGEGDTNNALFSVVGDLLFTADLLDPAVTPVCSVRLRSTDSGGLSVEKALQLPVAGVPVILEEPGDTPVFTGQPLALEVVASGRAPLAYQWLEDSVDLPGENGTVLQMTAGLPGSRSFRVRVSNALGVVTSGVAVVTVEPRSFGAWAARYAEADGPAILPADDLNADGIANWYDFVFGTEPDETAAILPTLRRGPDGLVYVYRRALHILPPRYDVLTADDLSAAWLLYVPDAADLTITPYGTSEEVEVPVPDTDRLFLKLEVAP